jgi:hypothetical protein
MVDSRPCESVLVVQNVSPERKQLAPTLNRPQPVRIKAQLCVKSRMNCAWIDLLGVENTDDHSLFLAHDKMQDP